MISAHVEAITVKRSRISYSCAGKAFFFVWLGWFFFLKSWKILIYPHSVFWFCMCWLCIQYCLVFTSQRKSYIAKIQKGISFFWKNLNPCQSLLTSFESTHYHKLVRGWFCSPFALLIQPWYFQGLNQKSYLEITFASLNLSSSTWK